MVIINKMLLYLDFINSGRSSLSEPVYFQGSFTVFFSIKPLKYYTLEYEFTKIFCSELL